MTATTAAIWRPTNGRLVLKIPFALGNRSWLHLTLGRDIRPDWNKTSQRWEIARPHLRTLAEACAQRFGTVDVFIDIRAIRKCETRCRDAEGDECDCQCLGTNHNGAAYWLDWIHVGDTTLVASAGTVRRHMRLVAQ